MIATHQLIPAATYAWIPTQTLDCTISCGSGSTGYVAPSIRPYCTDISAPVGTTVGQRSDTVHLKVGDDFSVAFSQYAWRMLATAATATWSMSAHIIVQPRSDNGLYNNAPVATVMSPINIPINQKTVINVPVADADGDITRCRWSTTFTECGDVCPPGSLPPSTVIYPNCTIVITGQHIDDWFAVTIMVEDFINSTSITPLSSVPVQFLVHVVAAASCTTPPEIIGIPEEQSCTALTVGQNFTSQLIAINYCGPSVTILDIATLSFPGMVQGTIVELNTSTYYNTMQWTPTTAQLGYQVMCAMAYDR
ncbi:unnamed protein product [Adineta steineri]|uniref:Uncharacterized protein n=1 Tax=Adineta steineri TaxID=433720 RepID=A0A819QU74_9BILA|nr:unnamed protein product [Adineta steineri]